MSRRGLRVPGVLTALLIFVIAASAFGSAGAGAAGPQYGDGGGGQDRFVPGQAILRFAAGASTAERHDALAAVGASVQMPLPVSGMRLIDIGPGLSVLQALRRLEAQDGVLYADPNYLYSNQSTVPNDPSFGQLWGLQNTGQSVSGTAGTAGADIEAPLAWDRTTGSSSISVGVIDTGILLAHPDLSGNLWSNPGEIPPNGIDADGNGFVDDVKGYDFAQNDSNPNDGSPLSGHGTHTSGTIGAIGNNGIGVAGVNWDVSLAGLKVFPDTSDQNQFGATSANLIRAIQYAGAKGLRVVNGSLGGAHPQVQSELDALQSAPSTLFVFAAGNATNNNDSNPFCPACYQTLPNVISVAATDQNDQLASFSNYGASTVNLGAPGVNILSTYVPSGSYAYASGTS